MALICKMFLAANAFFLFSGIIFAVEKLGVKADFEGASVTVLEINEKERSISFTPGGDPLRGWPCWWYFCVTGIMPGETITLKLKGSTATVMKSGAPLSKHWHLYGLCQCGRLIRLITLHGSTQKRVCEIMSG